MSSKDSKEEADKAKETMASPTPSSPPAVPAESTESTPERRVGLRGWLRGTAQRGLRNVGAGVVNNVMGLAGNVAGQVLQRSEKKQFNSYEALAGYLEKLLTENGKERIESVHYLSEILKYKAPNYESLSKTVGRDLEPTIPIINENAGLKSPVKDSSEGGGEGATEAGSGEIEPPSVTLENNPLKALAEVSVPPPGGKGAVEETELEKDKSQQGFREVFLDSKALEMAGMALMKHKPASEWENVAYRDLFHTSILLSPQTKDEYCESLLNTACKISEVWESVQLQSSNESSDAETMRGVIERLMEIVCSTLRALKYNPSVEVIRTKIDGLVCSKEKISKNKLDLFVKEKENVRIARELCDLVDEQQKLVQSLVSGERLQSETQTFLTDKLAELKGELESKASQIKDAVAQKNKAQKYREKKLNDLTESSSAAKLKHEQLQEREEKLKKELEMVRTDIQREESHIADLTEEIKLVEESSAEVIGSLTFAESELKGKHYILSSSLKAMDSVQKLYSEFVRNDDGWLETHDKSIVGLANNDCHSAQHELFQVCVTHLELCVQEGDRLLKQIKFCESELRTMRERAIEMENLGLMDEEGKEGKDVYDGVQDFSFVEEGLARIQAQHDKAQAHLETIIDDGLKTQAILDSEGVKDMSHVKLKMLVDRMNDFSAYLRGAKTQRTLLDISNEEEKDTNTVEAKTCGEEESVKEVKADNDSVEEYIEFLEQKLVPDLGCTTDVQLTEEDDSPKSLGEPEMSPTSDSEGEKGQDDEQEEEEQAGETEDVMIQNEETE